MADNNNGQIVLGLDIPKTVSQINADIKKLEKQLEQVKATGALDTNATVKQINAQLSALQSQLNTINIKTNIDTSSVKKKGNSIASEIFDTSDLDKQGKIYFTKTRNTIDKMMPSIESKFKGLGFSNIEVKGIEDATGKIKSFAVTASDAEGAIKKFNFEREKLQGGGKAQYGFVQSEDVQILKTASQAQEKLAQSTEKANAKLAEQVNKIQHSLSVGDYDTQLKGFETALKKAGHEGIELENTLKGAKTALDKLNESATADNIIPDDVVLKAQTLETEIEKLSNSVKNVKLDNSLIADDLKVSDTVTKLNEQLRKNSAYSQKAKDEIKKWIHELESGDVAETRLKQINSEAKKLHHEMANAGKAGLNWWDKFKQAIEKFGGWTIATTVLMKSVNAIRGAIDNVRELDDSLLELSKVSDLSADGLVKVTEEAYELGETVGRTGRQVINAITEFKRAGFDLTQSIELAEDALKMTNVAEGIDDASESAQYLISIMKGYRNTSSKFSTKILDAINEVSNTQAVDFDNLADGSQRLSAVANQAQVSFERMLGMLTGGYEVLGNMEKTASGLITIFTRLQSIQLSGEEDVESVAKLQETFSNATNGVVNIVDQTTGQLRGAYDILDDLNDIWDTLDKNTQEGLAFAAGGTRQKSVFLSIMSNWESVENSVKSATESMGSAEIENAKYLESISGKVSQFESAVEKLSSTIIDSDLIKFFVDLGTTGVKAVDGLINALSPLGTISTIGAGILGGKGLGLTNYVTHHSLQVPFYKVA